MRLKLALILSIVLIFGVVTSGLALADVEPTSPAEAFVTFEKTDDQDTVCAGGNFAYNLTFALDPSFDEVYLFPYLDPSYQQVVLINVTDFLPDGVNFVSASDGGDYNATAHSVFWSFEYLPEETGGEEKTLTIDVTETSGTPGILLVNEAELDLGVFAEDTPGITSAPNGLVEEYRQVAFLLAADETRVADCGGEIPEFPTVALPIAAILGLAFIFQRRKNE
ncbi:hypothetical protein J2755_000456 [Methanohalophilus levihalophilus]|uniref:PEF-CTERM sorting domain-containing protein n=1 Tax=Methanohalophilus levihalophilus TaxID=1431282 RepID=UPI001FD8DE0D|nr:PEF-CTERM sorting domain-containing protein [Methanohalophilus levihalophilus]MBP2029536.1 hypothetical protein [Methanohalophilus levihalophilus]